MTNLSKKKKKQEIKNKKQTVPIYRLEYVNPHYFMYLQLHTRLEIVKKLRKKICISTKTEESSQGSIL